MNVATWLYILFTQSKGYSDIKICSSYKQKTGTHLKPTVFLSHIYLKRIMHTRLEVVSCHMPAK